MLKRSGEDTVVIFIPQGRSVSYKVIYMRTFCCDYHRISPGVNVEVSLEAIGKFAEKYYQTDKSPPIQPASSLYPSWFGLRVLCLKGINSDYSQSWTTGVLSLYLSKCGRLPRHHELLICDSNK